MALTNRIYMREKRQN